MPLCAVRRLPSTTMSKKHSTEEQYEALVDAEANDENDKGAQYAGASTYTSDWMIVVSLCAVAAIICSVDRAAMSVAILPMSTQYKWKGSVKGIVGGSFNVGYTLTNLYGGYMATRFNAKHVLGCGVVVWSLFTLLTPPAAATGSLVLLATVRTAMGFGEGVTFPCVQSLVRGWAPPATRSRSLSFIYSGHQLGTILSLLLSPAIITSMGWQAVFFMFGTLGFAWILLWQPLVRDAAPLGSAHKGPQTRLADLPWRKLLMNKPFWAILLSHSTFGVGYNVAMMWLPSYYHDTFGVDVRQSALLSVLPWVVMAATTNLSGWVADLLVARRITSTLRARKLLQALGSGGPAVCLTWLSLQRDGHGAGVSVAGAVTALSFTTGLLGLQAGGFASNHQDISGRYAPLLFGMTNAASSLAGCISIYATGVVLEMSGSWSSVFLTVAICFASSCWTYLAWASTEQQFD